MQDILLVVIKRVVLRVGVTFFLLLLYDDEATVSYEGTFVELVLLIKMTV